MKFNPDLFKSAYDFDDDITGMFKSGIYGFSSNGTYQPDPHVGFSLRNVKSPYLNILERYKRETYRDIEIKKYKSRAYFYGGSVMFGYCSVSDIKTIPGYISILNKDVQITNFALPATTIVQNFSHYVNKVINTFNTFRENHYVSCLIGYNEFILSYRRNLKYGVPAISIHESVWGPAKIGQVLFRLPSYKMRLNEVAKEEFELNRLVGQVVNSIEVFRKVVEDFGGNFSVFLQPCLSGREKILCGRELDLVPDNEFTSNYLKFIEAINTHFENQNIIYDLTQLFLSKKFQIYIDQVHLGSKGNKLVAEKILEVF